jgi:hypothetical protein
LVDLQFGHLIPVDIGLPQLGQFSASVEMIFPQSGQGANPIKIDFW